MRSRWDSNPGDPSSRAHMTVVINHNAKSNLIDQLQAKFIPWLILLGCEWYDKKTRVHHNKLAVCQLNYEFLGMSTRSTGPEFSLHWILNILAEADKRLAAWVVLIFLHSAFFFKKKQRSVMIIISTLKGFQKLAYRKALKQPLFSEVGT